MSVFFTSIVSRRASQLNNRARPLTRMIGITLSPKFLIRHSNVNRPPSHFKPGIVISWVSSSNLSARLATVD